MPKEFTDQRLKEVYEQSIRISEDVESSGWGTLTKVDENTGNIERTTSTADDLNFVGKKSDTFAIIFLHEAGLRLLASASSF